MSAPSALIHSRLGEAAKSAGPSGFERRKRPRTRLQLPVRLYSPDQHETVDTVTRDLSSEGFYCFSRHPFSTGEMLQCMLTLPTHDRSQRELLLRCRIRVVRVEAADNQAGLACRIEDYHSVRRDPHPPAI